MGIGNFFKSLTKSKDPNSKRSRWDMAQMICGKHIRYVSEKQNDVDVVIGREGGFNIREDDLLVYASSKVVFRSKIDDLQIWELHDEWDMHSLICQNHANHQYFLQLHSSYVL